MKKLKIDLNYCYGIKNLKYEFDFNGGKNYLLYAPNGMMKTSFTKTFSALLIIKSLVMKPLIVQLVILLMMKLIILL